MEEPLQQLAEPSWRAQEGPTSADAPTADGSTWGARWKRCCSRLRRVKSAVRPYVVDSEEEEVGNGEPMNGGINPLVTSYVLPGDWRDRKRYVLTVAVVMAGCMWWMGPMIGVFVVDPMIQLTMSNMQVITPTTDCFDHRLESQVCEDAGVKASYYFYNITNHEEWLAGTAPPQYAEVGPYTFASSEVRYNMRYDPQWNQVQYTYHTFETFDPALSCPTCTLDDPLLVINRGYQQFYAAMRRMSATLAASTDDLALPEDQVKVMLMPLTLLDVFGRLIGAAGALGSSDPQADALSQWARCGLLRTLSGDTQFFLPTDPDDTAGIPYAPELCRFISVTLQAAGSLPDPVPPTDFAALGYELDLAAAGAWVTAAVGSSSPDGPDPAAQAFVARFLLLSRDTHLAYLATADPALAAALGPLTAGQWLMLQGFLGSLLGTYSSNTFSLFMAFGGAQLIAAEVQRVASRWTAMAAPTPEQAFVYTLLPLSVRTMLDAVTAGAMLPQVEAGIRADPGMAGYPADQPLPPELQEVALATAGGLTVQQWATCGVLGGAPLPVGPGGFPHAPELCAFIVANADSLGFSFAVTPAMFGELGLALATPVASAFLEAVAGTSTATSSDPFAQTVIQTFILAPDRATALAWLAAQGGDSAARATAMAPLTDLQFRVLQLYLIGLLPTWGKLVYATWLHQGQAGPGAAGIVVSRPVRQLLYGYEDPVLLASAQMTAPTSYQLAPYMYTVFAALSFPSQDWPLQYFSNVTGSPYTYGMLSYKDTDVGAFHPLVQQKLLLTGKASGDWPQTARMYRGVPYATKARGVLNVTGINEGIVQGSNFKPGGEPLQYESSISRAVKTTSTGSHVKVRKVKAYQLTLHPDSGAACNETRFEQWKNETGFDEGDFQAAMVALSSLKTSDPAAYWSTVQDDEALTAFLSTQDLGPLGPYFGPDQGAWLARCANPEHASFTWDVSDTYTCPTLVTLPRFYKSSAEVVDATGHADWNASYAAHGWYFSVEPNTGMSIHGHKGFLFSQAVTRTDVAYLDLWVAPGSRETALGRGMGMDDDFVLVPFNTVLLYWEPTKTTAAALRGLAMAKEGLYWGLVVGLPVLGWLILFPTLIYLKFSKYAKLRARELKKVQASTARKARLGRRQVAMADALNRLANGSQSVLVPSERGLDSTDDDSDGEEGGGAATPQDPGSKLAAKLQRGPSSRRRGSRLSAFEGKAAAAAEAERSTQAPDSPDAFSIATAPQAPASWADADGQAGSPDTHRDGVATVEAGPSDSVAVTLLPPGELLSSVPGSFRRSTGGGDGLRMRQRTTSTQEP